MSEPHTDELPDELKRDLDRRLADIDANPHDEMSWEELKAETLRELAGNRPG